MSWRALRTNRVSIRMCLFEAVFLGVLLLVAGAFPVHAQTNSLANPRARVSIEDPTKVQKIEPADTPFPIPRIRVDIDPARERGQIGTGLQILLLLTILSLAPSILIMLTSFTRILIVLNFVRRALTTQQEPSNQILIGLALFITFFTMSPVIDQVYREAVVPFSNKDIDYMEAYNRGIKPVRNFMFQHARKADLTLFAGMEGGAKPKTKDEFSTMALIPAFITSELRTAFQMGVVIYLPFLVIDLVVASVLMSMGMIMLPPVMISMPFKILLFVMVDGWNLVIKSLVVSFGGNA
ncbi:MAG TPA: flagellar type III secretion system pore protein FliP [Candidatus Ozemobacteraceae bacterium]|nr:flagellar type III secretion system pore protein FliP [Candidatus Ozemobacteraceae bacterium]